MTFFDLKKTEFSFLVLFISSSVACQSQFAVKLKTEKNEDRTQTPIEETDPEDGEDEDKESVVDPNKDKPKLDVPGSEDPEIKIPGIPLLTGLPDGSASSRSYSVTVAGPDVVTYAFRILQSSQACADVSPTTFFPVSQPITGLLTADDSYRLCVWTKSSTGHQRPTPSEHIWTVDTVDPVLTIATTGALGLSDLASGKLEVKGTFTDREVETSVISIRKDANDATCLNVGLTAFDADCTTGMIALTSSPWQVAIPVAALSDGSTYDIRLKVIDSAGNETVETSTFTMDTVVTLYLGVQTTGTASSYLQRLTYNYSTNAVSADGTVDVSSHVSPQLLRGVAALPDKRIIVTDGGSADAAIVGLDDGVSAAPTFSGATPALGDFHGICVMPNGNYIIGRYGGGSKVNQYDASGAFVREVYTTSINSLTSCHAVSNTEILLIDYDADNDNNGDLVRMELVGTVWTPAGRWVQSTSGLGAGSSIYSLAVLNNGDIYLLPQNGSGSRNKKMIRCVGGDLASCAVVGADIISGTDVFAQGLALIPGTNDLIFGTNKRLVRFNTSDYSTTVLSFDVSTLPFLSQLRHIIIR